MERGLYSLLDIKKGKDKIKRWPSKSEKYAIVFDSRNSRESKLLSKENLHPNKVIHFITNSGGVNEKGQGYSHIVMHWIERSALEKDSLMQTFQSTKDYNQLTYYRSDHFSYGKWLYVTPVEHSTKILLKNTEVINDIEVLFVASSREYLINGNGTFTDNNWLNQKVSREYLHAYILKPDFSLEIFQPLSGPMQVYQHFADNNYSASLVNVEMVNNSRAKKEIAHFIRDLLEIQ